MSKERDCIEVTIKCNDSKEALSMASHIHTQLVGLPDYVGNENNECGLILNVDGDTITIVVGNECSTITKVTVFGWGMYYSMNK